MGRGGGINPIPPKKRRGGGLTATSGCVQRDSATRISTSGFFHESVSPKPLSIQLGPFQFFFENSRRYLQLNVHQMANGEIFKLKSVSSLILFPFFAIDVVDTSCKFSACIIDTDDKFATGISNISSTGGKICCRFR
jgi:hypothetical protein